MSDLLPAHPEAERFIVMADVMKLYGRNKPIREIANEVGITQKEVRSHIEEWKKTAVGGAFLKERVTELLAVLDEHFSDLIDEIWNTIEQINEAIDIEGPKAPLLAQRISALKTAADLDAKRVETLQKAGLLEAADLGDEIAQMEEEHAQLIQILKDVTGTCPNCRIEIANRISALTGETVGVPGDIEGEIVE